MRRILTFYSCIICLIGIFGCGGGSPATQTPVSQTPQGIIDVEVYMSSGVNFLAGKTGSYYLEVDGVGSASTGAITITQTLPNGLGFVSYYAEDGPWTCSASGQIVTCNSPYGLPGGSPTGYEIYDLDITVSVGSSLVATSVTSTATVSTAGDTNPANNSASVTTAITRDEMFGPYAFMLSGFDQAGNPIGMAGSITADGNGAITAGQMDVNDNLTVATSTTPLTGIYTLDSNLRGTITITSLTPSRAFAFSLKSDGSFGDIVSLDTGKFVAGGTIERQLSNYFAFPYLAGDYAFKFDSNAPTRQSTVGHFTLASSGAVTNGLLDKSVAGTGPFLTDSSFTSTFSGAGSNGRGTLTIVASGTTTNYAYYVIHPRKFVVVQTDSSPASNSIQTGVAVGQYLPAVNTAGSVFALTGVHAGGVGDISAIGVLQVSNSNNATVHWDSNDASTLHAALSANGQTVTFDPSSGRGTITVTNGFTNGLFDSAVFYLNGSGAGFMLDTTAGVNNRDLAGVLQPQAGIGSFSLASITGNMIFRSNGTSLADNGSRDGLLTVTPSSTFSVVSDARVIGYPDAVNVSQSGTLAVAIDANTGRGTFTGKVTNFVKGLMAFYIVGGDQFVGLDMTPAPSNGDSPIWVFETQ
jgi:Domain of unknown function DUF11